MLGNVRAQKIETIEQKNSLCDHYSRFNNVKELNVNFF